MDGMTPQEALAVLDRLDSVIREDADWPYGADQLTQARTTLAALVQRVESYKRDAQLGRRLEGWICMYTVFSGDPPYVGDDGLVLALDHLADECVKWKEARNAERERAEQAEAELARVREDARRYAWLRENAEEVWWYAGPESWTFESLRYASEDERARMDAAIDALIPSHGERDGGEG